VPSRLSVYNSVSEKNIASIFRAMRRTRPGRLTSHSHGMGRVDGTMSGRASRGETFLGHQKGRLGQERERK
jgi:hypothetical protein